MAKRQVRIYKPTQEIWKDELLGQSVSLCLEEGPVILCMIVGCKGEMLLVKDKLLHQYAFVFSAIREIIFEKENTI